MKKVYLVHGWGGESRGGWFDLLKNIFEEKGIKVIAEDMPDTSYPKIEAWTSKLKQLAIEPDEETYFIGHSIGCQAIMRYLEMLPKNVKIGGAIFVAGWFNLNDETWDEEYTEDIAKPWLEIPINFNKIKEHTKKFLVILSDDDPYVPLSDAKLFEKNLNAKVIIEKNQGHIEELNNNEIKKIQEFVI
jgi:uncharacterized protein